jgi:hypothetical protein
LIEETCGLPLIPYRAQEESERASSCVPTARTALNYSRDNSYQYDRSRARKAANKALTGAGVGAVDANLGLKVDPPAEQRIAGAARTSPDHRMTIVCSIPNSWHYPLLRGAQYVCSWVLSAAVIEEYLAPVIFQPYGSRHIQFNNKERRDGDRYYTAGLRRVSGVLRRGDWFGRQHVALAGLGAADITWTSDDRTSAATMHRSGLKSMPTTCR